MSTNDPVKALEELNMEYLRLREDEPPEYVLGRRIKHFKENFPHVIRWIVNYYKSKQKQNKIDSISNYVKSSDLFYANPKPVNDKKGVVYSCITCGYDAPYEPILLNENLSYVLFTDYDKKENSIWEYRKSDVGKATVKNNYINRFYKFHPFDIFVDYDYSIYIDGNVQVVSDITSLYRVAHASKTGIAMHSHFAKNCAYKDALWCEYSNRGNIEAIKKQMERYKLEGFPTNYGLCEATIIVVDLHSETAKKLIKDWWEEFDLSGSGRDQMAFPYVLWKNGFTINDVGCLGNDEYHNPKFRINAHKGELF